ncbi:MAG: 8-amino-7-oxononanoate synthase [Chthoniobacterales bacterium]|nr:8-amino-7-oxononanoate synthase [Chthoniobacterales bacterium]
MMEEFLQQSLDDLENRSLRRRLKVSASATGPTVRFGGEALHNFASNDYLGLASHHDVVGAAVRATRDFGAGAGASRLVSGTQGPHAELEEKLATFKGAEAALTFSSGYAASTGTLQALAGKDDVILLDRLSHACLIDGARLCGAACRVFAHNDVGEIEHHLRWAREKHPQARIFVATEAVFSMDGDTAPLAEIVALKEKFGALLMLDEAHATGVLGSGGRGLAEQLALSPRIDIHMGTLGKALGSAGGYIAGSRTLIDFLVNRARSFIFSTAPPASTAAAAAAALDICAGEEGDRSRAQLRKLAAIFDPAMPAAIHPVIMGDADTALRCAEALQRQGFFVPAIRPPTVRKGTARLRVSLTAAHQESVARSLASALRAQRPDADPSPSDPDTVCPVCAAPLVSEKCKVVCRSATCGYRIVFNCSEF